MQQRAGELKRDAQAQKQMHHQSLQFNSGVNMKAELLSCADVGRVLKIGPQRVRQLERLGRLSATRTAGGWRLFRREEVERFAAQRELKPGRINA